MAQKQKPPSRTADQFVVRLPAGMRDRIKSLSDELERSMNAQIVFMLQSYLDRMDGQGDELQTGLHEHGGSAVPADSPALFKVMLFEELMVLRRRIEDLGGSADVLRMSKGDIVKLLSGPRIAGTKEEQQSYYARTVGATPLTALMTDDEINKLASRIVDLQESHHAAARPSEAMLAPLAVTMTPTNTTSRTPKIPGQNAPKKGLGRAPKGDKVQKD